MTIFGSTSQYLIHFMVRMVGAMVGKEYKHIVSGVAMMYFDLTPQKFSARYTSVAL